MLLTVKSVEKKKRLLEESYVLIERLKKIRALNCSPSLVGINPRFERTLGNKR
jgi:hypothetical protein